MSNPETPELPAPAVRAELTTLGRRIRALRRRRRLTLAALAEETGYTTGFLSLIETGARLPSLSALAGIAAALRTDLSELFDLPAMQQVRLVRGGEAPELHIGGGDDAASFRLYVARGTTSAFGAMIEDGAATAPSRMADLFGERLVYMLSGSLRLTVRDQTYELEAGDCLHVASHGQYEREIVGDGPADILWVTDPPLL